MKIEIEKMKYKEKIDLEVLGSSFNITNDLKFNLNIKPELNSVVKLNYSFKCTLLTKLVDYYFNFKIS